MLIQLMCIYQSMFLTSLSLYFSSPNDNILFTDDLDDEEEMLNDVMRDTFTIFTAH